MKGKMLIVLFSLALIFGAIVASCDNGVLPPPPTDPYHTELEFVTSAGDVYVDFYNNGKFPALEFPGDGNIDVGADGEEIKMTVEAAADLVGKKIYGWTFTLTAGTNAAGEAVTILKLQ